MPTPDVYSLLSLIADAAVKKSAEKQKGDNPPAPSATAAPAPEKRRSFADRKTVVEMIRRHDERSRRIFENAKNFSVEVDNPENR